MKKAVSMLLVLTMVLALAGTAMAACKIEKGWVVFTKDANSYNAAKESKKPSSTFFRALHLNQRLVCSFSFTIKRAKLPQTLSHLAMEPSRTTLLVFLLSLAAL